MRQGTIMGIPILSEIERLINEHGSAAILKERLALASDQYSALEKKLSDASAREEHLRSENARLRTDLEKAQKKIQSLEEQVVQRHGQRLDEVKEKILVLLASHDDYDGNIAQTLGIGNQVAAFHLEELEKMEFIYRSLSMTGEIFPWCLVQEGRRYLVTHGLIA
jgi:DNA repair exonuclease SbcCD ATPase subunit